MTRGRDAPVPGPTGTNVQVTGRQRHPPQLGDLWGSVRTSSGELVGIDSALRIVTVYACVRVLAETVASP